MNAHEILAAWESAQGSTFYEDFYSATGFTRPEVDRHFSGWCRLGHKKAVELAKTHGIPVREGGFQAYLADRWKRPTVCECWVPGEPTVEGWYLVRLEDLGNIGFRVFFCFQMETGDKTTPLSRMVYMDQSGGNHNNHHHNRTSLRGTVTHHCEPTGANFEAALKEWQSLYPPKKGRT